MTRWLLAPEQQLTPPKCSLAAETTRKLALVL